jgi:hypothetical protein
VVQVEVILTVVLEQVEQEILLQLVLHKVILVEVDIIVE